MLFESLSVSPIRVKCSQLLLLLLIIIAMLSFNGANAKYAWTILFLAIVDVPLAKDCDFNSK